MSFLWNALDFVPVIGIVKNAGEALVAFKRGDFQRGVSKTAQAVIGGVVDVASFGVGTMIFKSVTKTGTQILITHAVVAAGSLASSGRIGIYVATMPSTSSGRLQQIPNTVNEEMFASTLQELFYVGDQGEQERSSSNDNDGNNLPHGNNIVFSYVINVDVVNLIRRNIETFIRNRGFTFEQLVEEGHITNTMAVFNAYHGSLPQHIVNNIQNVMRLQGYTNVDINYDERRQRLEDAVSQFMTVVFEREDRVGNVEQQVENMRTNVNTEAVALTNAFVNVPVRRSWLNPNMSFIPERMREELANRRIQIYDETEDAVATMLTHLSNDSEFWALEIYEAIQNHNNNN